MIELLIGNIIFQFGEFIGSESGTSIMEYFVNLLIAIIGAVVGGLIALKAVRMQINNDRDLQEKELSNQAKKDEESKLESANDKLNYFAWLVNNIEKVATKQNEEYKTLADKISANQLGFHKLVTRATTDLQRLQTLDQEDIFHAFLVRRGRTEENIERFQKMYSRLDFIDGVLKEVPRLYLAMQVEVHTMTLEYRQYIEEIREGIVNICEDIRIKRPVVYVTDPLWKLLNKRLVEYENDMPEDGGIDWHHVNFLRPLQEELVRAFLDSKEVTPLLTAGRRASVVAGRIKFSTDSMAKDIEYYYKKLNETLEELRKDYTDLL